MDCPRCAKLVLPGSTVCSHCGYCLGVAGEIFGREEIFLGLVCDHAEVLPARESRRLTRLIANFEARFPNFWFAVCLADLPEEATLAEFGFWLINHVCPAERDEPREPATGVILIVDPAAKEAGWSLGYGAEAAIGEEALRDALSAAQGAFAKGRIGRACRVALAELARFLAKIAKNRSQPEIPAPQPILALPAAGRQPETQPNPEPAQ